MKFTLNEINQSEKEISIELDYPDFKDELDEEVKKQAKKIQIAGFRKGKVPPSILRQRFGDALEYEASEKVANSQFWKIAEENDLRPIGTPILTDIKFNPGQDLSFKVKFEMLPSLEPRNYTGLEILIPNFEVTDHDVEHELGHILKASSTLEDADFIENEFFKIKIDFQRVNENVEPFEDSKSEVLEVDLSDHHVHHNIRENAKGKKVGDSFQFSFEDERPKDPNSDEKIVETLHYKALIKEIKKIVMPELNEELVKKLTKDRLSSPEEFKAEIRKDIQNYYNQQTEDYTRRKLIGTIVKNNDFTPPNTLIQKILEDLVKQEENNSKKYGVKKFDRNIAREQLLPSAEFEVKWYLLRDMIIKKENLSISEAEINELAVKDAEKTGIAVEKLINYYQSPNVSEKIVDKKLFDLLKEKNNFVKTSPDKLS